MCASNSPEFSPAGIASSRGLMALSGGVFFTCFDTSVSSLSSLFNHPWIIDLGASHHMTGMSSIFSLSHVCLSRHKILIANNFVQETNPFNKRLAHCRKAPTMIWSRQHHF